MKVIFLRDVPKIARKYDIKDVADGFAHNNLIPRKLAVIATAAAVARIEAERAASAHTAASTERRIHEIEEASALKPLVIKASANAEGRLFEGVSAGLVAASINDAYGLTLKPADVDLAHPLKVLGTAAVPVHSGSARGVCTITIEAK